MALALSVLPVALVVAGLVALRWPATWAALLGLAGGVGVSLLPMFHAPWAQAPRLLADSVLTALSVAYVLFFGLLLFQLLEQGGAVAELSAWLLARATDPAWLGVLTVLAVGPFVEAVTGFGMSVLVVAPMLLAAGFAEGTALALSLLAQSLVPWGALAVGTAVGAGLAGVSFSHLGLESALWSAPVLWLYAFLALWLAGGQEAVRRLALRTAALALLLGLALVALSRAFDPDVAGVAAPLAAGGAGLLWGARRRPKATTAPRKALMPYGCLLTLLLATRLWTALRTWLNSHLVLSLGGNALPLLYSPGFLLLLSGVLAWALHRAHFHEASWRDVWRRTLSPWLRVSLVTFLLVALSNVMAASGMIRVLAGLLTGAGRGFLPLAALIAALGGFLTGSNTAGNAMFMRLQVALARSAGLNPALVAGLQNTVTSNLTWASAPRLSLAAAAIRREVADVLSRAPVYRCAASVLAAFVALAAVVGMLAR